MSRSTLPSKPLKISLKRFVLRLPMTWWCSKFYHASKDLMMNSLGQKIQLLSSSDFLRTSKGLVVSQRFSLQRFALLQSMTWWCSKFSHASKDLTMNSTIKKLQIFLQGSSSYFHQSHDSRIPNNHGSHDEFYHHKVQISPQSPEVLKYGIYDKTLKKTIIQNINFQSRKIYSYFFHFILFKIQKVNRGSKVLFARGF